MVSGDGCDLAYDLLRVMWLSIFSELIMCSGGVRSMLLLPLVARCVETIDVCIWRMFDICLL